jgi:nicotinate-nucleotide diphosphorylase (carboxylating)
MNRITMELNADEMILLALKEDITFGDISSDAVLPKAAMGSVELIAKQDGVIAGLPVFKRVFELIDGSIDIKFMVADGDLVHSGEKLAVLRGDLHSLLSGERTALNYLQHMSGIATYTRSMADILEGSGIKLLDTRKTTPCNRIFEKYAVKVGGGNNHRFNLSDGVMLKDNHIAAAGGIKNAVAMAKKEVSFVRKIEVEVENLNMVREAVEAGADIIMLDNMDYETMKEALKIIDGKAETECSGNVTAENVAKLAALGVNYISSGALTHSAPILDISMKNMHLEEICKV